jgi:hypothetical protein
MASSTQEKGSSIQTQFKLIVVAGSMIEQVGFSVFFKGISLEQSSRC